jgi:hypothetical protein
MVAKEDNMDDVMPRILKNCRIKGLIFYVCPWVFPASMYPK